MTAANATLVIVLATLTGLVYGVELIADLRRRRPAIIRPRRLGRIPREAVARVEPREAVLERQLVA